MVFFFFISTVYCTVGIFLKLSFRVGLRDREREGERERERERDFQNIIFENFIIE